MKLNHLLALATMKTDRKQPCWASVFLHILLTYSSYLLRHQCFDAVGLPRTI